MARRVRSAALARLIIDNQRVALSRQHVEAVLRMAPESADRLEERACGTSGTALLTPLVSAYAHNERFDDALRVVRMANHSSSEVYGPLIASCIMAQNDKALADSVRLSLVM